MVLSKLEAIIYETNLISLSHVLMHVQMLNFIMVKIPNQKDKDTPIRRNMEHTSYLDTAKAI